MRSPKKVFRSSRISSEGVDFSGRAPLPLALHRERNMRWLRRGRSGCMRGACRIYSRGQSHLRAFIHNAPWTLKWRIPVKNRRGNATAKTIFERLRLRSWPLIVPHYSLVTTQVYERARAHATRALKGKKFARIFSSNIYARGSAAGQPRSRRGRSPFSPVFRPFRTRSVSITVKRS